MRPSSLISAACVASLAAGAAISLPAYAAILSGYTDADVDFPQTPSPIGDLPSVPPSASQVEAVETSVPRGAASGAAPPRVGEDFTGPTSHGPYNGPEPTTTGALSNSPLAASIAPQGPNPTATYYNQQGVLLQQQPAPYTPAGKFI
jgi:hypothetical protein